MDHDPLPEQAAALAYETPPGTLGLFRRNPDFTRLYAAQLVSFAGDWLATVALLHLVLTQTGSPALAALVVVAMTLPFAIVSPYAGVLADRLDRKTIMISSDVIRGFLAIGFIAAESRETIWVAFVCLTALSAVSAFFDPASSAALPHLVAKQDLARANVLMGSSWGTMLVVGAALGGLVVAVFGNTTAFVGDAASFGISASLLLTVRGRFHETAPSGRKPDLVRDVRETVAFAKREPRVLALLAVKAGFGMSAGVIGLISVFAVTVFHGGPGTLGLLQSARGAGALAGPFIFRRWAGAGTQRLFLGLTVAGLVFGAGYVGFALAPTVWVAALAACVAHMGGGSIWTLSTYGLQRFTPDEIRGRVFSFDYGLVTLSIAGSVFLAGLAADHFNPRIVAAGVAVIGIIGTLAWTVWRRRLLRGAGATAPSA